MRCRRLRRLMRSFAGPLLAMCSPRSVPPDLLAVVKTGRKVSLQSVFITQEPRELNETLLAEGTEFVCFRLQGLNSLGKLADYGMPGQSQLPTLPAGQFIGWNKLSGECGQEKSSSGSSPPRRLCRQIAPAF